MRLTGAGPSVDCPKVTDWSATGERSTPTSLRAAEYVRMSTEHQQYSTENQSAALRRYARQRSIEIVRTYADEGRSGLRLDGRDALKQLIKDVESGTADFTAILVYDVSRWGRFQDADESAYYEYICKRAGVTVQCRHQARQSDEPDRGAVVAREQQHPCLVRIKTIVRSCSYVDQHDAVTRSAVCACAQMVSLHMA